MVKLILASPVDPGQLKELEKSLRQVQGLRVVLVGSSVEEGTRVMVSVEESIPLVGILSEMSAVEQVAKAGRDIRVTLLAP